MTRLTESEHQALMDDMKGFDEQMPCGLKVKSEKT